jgi:hypothetical protein
VRISLNPGTGHHDVMSGIGTAVLGLKFDVVPFSIGVARPEILSSGSKVLAAPSQHANPAPNSPLRSLVLCQHISWIVSQGDHFHVGSSHAFTDIN